MTIDARYLRDALHAWELEFSDCLADAPELFIPAETGIQNDLALMDSGLRRNDEQKSFVL